LQKKRVRVLLPPLSSAPDDRVALAGAWTRNAGPYWRGRPLSDVGEFHAMQALTGGRAPQRGTNLLALPVRLKG